MPEKAEGTGNMLHAESQWLSEVLKGILSLLFPNRCAGCDRIDVTGFCSRCLSLLDAVEPLSSCRRCGNQIPPVMASSQGICSDCRRNPPGFTAATAAYRYSGPLARGVVLWKYEGHRYLTATFVRLLIESVSERAPEWWESIEAIIPAPHHPSTLRTRGFSPPEELSESLARAFGVAYLPRVLFKVRKTPPQAGLPKEIRLRNLAGSMMVFDNSMIEGKAVLVVDDVMTTGATIEECSRALLAAGAAKVYGLVLAKQSHGRRT
jgi:competence protein ComFC